MSLFLFVINTFQHVFESDDVGLVEVSVSSSQNVSVSSEIATSTVTPDKHDYIRTDVINPNIEIFELKNELKKVKEENTSLKKSLKVARRRILLLQKSVESLKSGNVSKKTEDIICRRKLKRTHTEAQMDFILSDTPKKRSKKYVSKDFSVAYKVLSYTGKKGYQFVRGLLHSPSLSLLQQKFGFMSIRPGIFTKLLTYIEKHVSHQESWVNGHGKLSEIQFDEVSMQYLALYDVRFDCVIGELPYILILAMMIGFFHSYLSNNHGV